MRIEEVMQKASKLLEAGLKDGTPDPFLYKLTVEAKETALTLLGDESGEEALVRAFLELVLAAYMMDIDLESEVSTIFKQKVDKELAEAA